MIRQRRSRSPDELTDHADVTAYRPLAGVRVLDLGSLMAPSPTSAKLVALGADVEAVLRDWLGC
jgi:hypothetical protein